MSQDQGRVWERMIAALGAGMVCGVGAAHAAPQPAEVSCQFRDGPAHLGVQAGPAPANLDGLAWKVPLGGPIVAGPVLCDGVIYVGAKDGGFSAVDPATGKVRWRFAADAPVTATPRSPAVWPISSRTPARSMRCARRTGSRPGAARPARTCRS